MNTKYQEALDFLFSQLPMFSRTGAPAYKPGLDTSINLAKFFDDPQDKFKSIHVAGTNGKGSTSHMLASVLQAQGYKTALYTSPHLIDFRERMKINGKMIPEAKVVEFVEKWKQLDFDGNPSFFELTMIMAFQWFAEEKVDYAVIEVGMGGRLDSTNIITPMLSIITNISFDHNQFLGETLPQIAFEKAGIIKNSIPVVVGEYQDETADVFIKKAQDTRSPIIFADKETPLEIEKSDNSWLLNYSGQTIRLSLGGDYQKKNLTTVIAAVEQMKRLDIKVTDDNLNKGISNVEEFTGLKGRWTILSRHPLTIADTGHNIAGLSYNFSQLKELLSSHPGGKLRVVIGFVADKAINKIMNLLPQDAIYYVSNAQIPRALPAEKLHENFQENNLESRKFESVPEAYETAKTEASEKDIIFIGGSTFVVADLLAELYRNK